MKLLLIPYLGLLHLQNVRFQSPLEERSHRPIRSPHKHIATPLLLMGLIYYFSALVFFTYDVIVVIDFLVLLTPQVITT